MLFDLNSGRLDPSAATALKVSFCWGTSLCAGGGAFLFLGANGSREHERPTRRMISVLLFCFS